MDNVNPEYLKQLITRAQQLRSNAVLNEPEEEGVRITYLPCFSPLKNLGNIDSPEYQYNLSRCGLFGIRERETRPFGRLTYHRILRKDGQVLRIETYFGGKLQCTRLFRYEENTRYCVTFQTGKPHCEAFTEAVILEDGRITQEFREANNRIWFRNYVYREDGTVEFLYVDYSPYGSPSLHRHSKGTYTFGRSVRYRETFLWKAGDGPDSNVNKIWLHRILDTVGRICIGLAILGLLFYPILIAVLLSNVAELWGFMRLTGTLLIPLLVAAFTLSHNRHRTLRQAAIFVSVFAVLLFINLKWAEYDKSITIDTAPNIYVNEYLPFRNDSKIVHLEQDAPLELTGELPRLDGAAAVFPVYSSFVDAVYPRTTRLYDGTFEYNNTVGGYAALAEKATDIFFGAYPSEEQIAYAREQGTEFIYTPIGMDAFVFFVHKDNPIENLTSQQLRGIYSGQITNWAQVGGKDEPIAAYQRNEGSGSQSMLIRFMGDTPIMEPETEMVNGMMSGIIEQVAAYRSKSGSIGFSFRFYVEGIIQNPDIKMLSIDGVAPTVENIQSGTYPITGPLYAVTWEGNDNPNVALLLDWILSEEGQWIISETGYVPLDIELCLPQ